VTGHGEDRPPATPDDQQLANTPMYAKTMAELRGMSDDDLVTQHDRMVTEMGYPRYVIQLGYYVDELRRRDAARESAAAIRLAKLSLGVAVVAALAALLAVLLAA
jgi:hypothetical protein